MIKVIYRKRNFKNSWDRWFVTVKDGDIESLDFMNPLFDKRAKLDYLKVTFPNKDVLKVKYVIDAIPKDIMDKVYAIEFHICFGDYWYLELFKGAWEEKADVAFVALLTKENTGKDLPSRSLTDERPIGISDEDWENVRREFYLNKM